MRKANLSDEKFLLVDSLVALPKETVFRTRLPLILSEFRIDVPVDKLTVTICEEYLDAVFLS